MKSFVQNSQRIHSKDWIFPPVTVQGSIIGVGKVWKTIEVNQMTKIQDGCEDPGPACLCF